ncbi:hypothetical protein MC885_006334 [Smutsia gigantea]|nr:hypothetical protein MC885_006334 [Smutsia gigantea]
MDPSILGATRDHTTPSPSSPSPKPPSHP